MRKIIKLTVLKQGWSHCHRCGKSRHDKGYDNANNKLNISLRHGRTFDDIFLCDLCLKDLVEEVKKLRGGDATEVKL